MDNLTMDLIKLCRRNRDGSFGTQKNRQRGLAAIAEELDSLGYRLPVARSIKPKHVEALVEKWKGADLDDATIRNRLTWLRWWAQKVNKQSIIARDNRDYGVETRREPTNKAIKLDHSKYRAISCAHVRASMLLQVAFGLRREEAMKFRPQMAVQSDQIQLKASWTKGGRARTIPITTDAQRKALHIAFQLAKGGSLIPPHLTYAEHLKRYEYQTLKAGMRNTHGFRHAYAQQRYLALTGKPCPLAGGKSWNEMTEKERRLDRAARFRISGELGHGRLEITNTYLGRADQ